MVSQKTRKEKDKALAKIIDSSNIQSRLKALKACLETIPVEEMKRYLSDNNFAYFYVWYDFYTLHVDPMIRNHGNKAISKDVRDDLATLFYVIEKLIHLMPEKLCSGWHCNSLSSFLKRLLTYDCCTQYRFKGVKLFLAWFQIVKTKAPADMVFLFSTLIPGLDQTKLLNSSGDRHDLIRTKIVADPHLLSHMVSVTSASGSPTSHDPLVPASQTDLAQQTLDVDALNVLTHILNHLILNITSTCWTDSRGRVESFEFMLNQFRQKYLFKIFQDYNHKIDLYGDGKTWEPEDCVNEERDLIVEMKVLVIQWIINIIPPSDYNNNSESGSTGTTVGGSSSTLTPSIPASKTPTSSNRSSLITPNSETKEAFQIAYQVLTSSRDNINMCLEILRQGLLLPLSKYAMTKKVIDLLTLWLEVKESHRPIFVQAPQLEREGVNLSLVVDNKDMSVATDVNLEDSHSSTLSDCTSKQPSHIRLKHLVNVTNFSESLDESKMRSIVKNPKPKRCVSEVEHTSVLKVDSLKVGLQKYLQYVLRALSVVFYVQHQYHPYAVNEINYRENNTEIRRRVINVFRLAASGSGGKTLPLIESTSTWRYAINILSHATKYLFDNNLHVSSHNQDFISNLINTLIVNCIKSNLFVKMDSAIWDNLTELLSSIVHKSHVVVEQWAKTMKFLTTNILSPIVYGIDYSQIENEKQLARSTLGSSSRRIVRTLHTEQAKMRATIGPTTPPRSTADNSKDLSPKRTVTLTASQPRAKSALVTSSQTSHQPTQYSKDQQQQPQSNSLGESFTTQALTSMLKLEAPKRPPLNETPLADRPKYLFMTENKKPPSKQSSKRNKTYQHKAGGSLVTSLSKSENNLYSPSSPEETFAKQAGESKEDNSSSFKMFKRRKSKDLKRSQFGGSASKLFTNANCSFDEKDGSDEDGCGTEYATEEDKDPVRGQKKKKYAFEAQAVRELKVSVSSETASCVTATSGGTDDQSDADGSSHIDYSQMSCLMQKSTDFTHKRRASRETLAELKALRREKSSQFPSGSKESSSAVGVNSDQLLSVIAKRGRDGVVKSERPSSGSDFSPITTHTLVNDDYQLEKRDTLKAAAISQRKSWSSETEKARTTSQSSSVRFSADTSHDPDSDQDGSIFHNDHSNLLSSVSSPGETEENEATVGSELAKNQLPKKGSEAAYNSTFVEDDEDEESSNATTADFQASQNSRASSSVHAVQDDTDLESSWAHLTSDNRSLLTGGEVTGWTREAAFILWRRILGIIGNVNDIKDNRTYSTVFVHLLELHDILQNMANYQSFIDEETGQFMPPLYVPPVPILLPWAIGGCKLIKKTGVTMGMEEDSFETQFGITRGVYLAHRLAAKIVQEYPALHRPIITSFYQIVYENMKIDSMLLRALFVKELHKLYCCNIPGSMVLLKVLAENASELVHMIYNPSQNTDSATSAVLQTIDGSCTEEAILFLGSLVCFPSHYKKWRCLDLKREQSGKVVTDKGQTVTCIYQMDHLVQSIFNSVVCSSRHTSFNLPASSRSLSIICIAALSALSTPSNCNPLKNESEPVPQYSFEQCLNELLQHIKFNRSDNSNPHHLSTQPVVNKYINTADYMMAHITTHYVLTVFDALLHSQPQSPTIPYIVTHLVSSLNELVALFPPQQKMLDLAIVLLQTICDCMCKLPADVLTTAAKVDVDAAAASASSVNSNNSMCDASATYDEDDKSISSLPLTVYNGLNFVQSQCRSWISNISTLETTTDGSMHDSEHSLDHDINNSNSLQSQRTTSIVTNNSSSSSSTLSATTAGLSNTNNNTPTATITNTANYPKNQLQNVHSITTPGPSSAPSNNASTSPPFSSQNLSPAITKEHQLKVAEKLLQVTELVSNVILGMLGHYPSLEGGVTKLDSAITEADDNPAAIVSGPSLSSGGLENESQEVVTSSEMSHSLIDNDYTQLFVYDENTIITVLELPPPSSASSRNMTLGKDTKSVDKIVRFIIRDLSGKYCYDFIRGSGTKENFELNERELNQKNSSPNKMSSKEDDKMESSFQRGDSDVCDDTIGEDISEIVKDDDDEDDNDQTKSDTDMVEYKDEDSGLLLDGTSSTLTLNENSVKANNLCNQSIDVSIETEIHTSDIDTLRPESSLVDDVTLVTLTNNNVNGNDEEEDEKTTEHMDVFLAHQSCPSTEQVESDVNTKYDILDYLDSNTEDPSRIPNALNEILHFLSSSPDLLNAAGDRLDAPSREPTGYVARFKEDIDKMKNEMLEQEKKEIEIGSQWNTDQTSQMNNTTLPFIQISSDEKQVHEERPFASSATLLMHLNCFSWSNRNRLFLLNKTSSLIKELKHLDTQSLRETHKFAVIFVANGQETKNDILSNTGGSKEYELFVAGLGWDVEVETHKGYLGLLPSDGSLGRTTPYFASPTCEIVYHTATRMRGAGLNQKWRHIGNDHVHIVWNEHCRPYSRSVMPTQFADVLIVLTPMPNKLILVNISCKHPIQPQFLGPLFDGVLINFAILPVLVRATALRANSMLKQLKDAPLFFASRQKTIATIVKRFKLMQTFEDFVFQSVNPQPKSNQNTCSPNNANRLSTDTGAASGSEASNAHQNRQESPSSSSFVMLSSVSSSISASTSSSKPSNTAVSGSHSVA